MRFWSLLKRNAFSMNLYEQKIVKFPWGLLIFRLLLRPSISEIIEIPYKDIKFLMIFLCQHEKSLIISFVNLIVRRVFEIQWQVYLVICSVCTGLFNTEVLLIQKSIFENWCWASSNLPLPCGFRIYHIDCGCAWVQSYLLISSFLATRYLVSREDYLS